MQAINALLIASKLPIKTLVARQLPTNTHTHTHTLVHAYALSHTNTHKHIVCVCVCVCVYTYLALVNVIHLSSDGRYGQWLQHTALTDQALGAIHREMCPTAGADCHLQGWFGAGLG